MTENLYEYLGKQLMWMAFVATHIDEFREWLINIEKKDSDHDGERE